MLSLKNIGLPPCLRVSEDMSCFKRSDPHQCLRVTTRPCHRRGVFCQTSDSAPTPSYYMRRLPFPAISLRTPEGNRLFDEARAEGYAAGSLDIIGLCQTQGELTYCGLSSLTAILNALGTDPQRVWKGPWRWYDESMLVDKDTLARVTVEGITFERLAEAVPLDKVKLQAILASDCSLIEFREHVKRVTSSNNSFILLSYSRQMLKQTGNGHFSPLAAYNAASDSILIMDVARYKYPAHWITCSMLWRAMCAMDEMSGKSRGFMVMSR